MRIKFYLVMLGLYLFAAPNLFSQTQYTGPAGGDWSNPTYWNNGLPANGNNALIGGGASVAINSPLNVDFTITNYGSIAVNGLMTSTGSLDNSGSLTFSVAAGLINQGVFNNYGNAEMGIDATFINEVGASFINIGGFNIQTTLLNKGSVTNNGEINAASGTLLTEGTFINNQGLTTESLTVSGGSSFTNNFGSNLIITGVGAKLIVDGSFNNLGSLVAEGDFTVNGNFSNSSSVSVIGTLTVSSSASFNNAGGVVENYGNVQNQGTFINGFQLKNIGSFLNLGQLNNNNYIEVSNGGTFVNGANGSISMGFGSKIMNYGTVINEASLDSYGTLENIQSFENSGSINSFSGSKINNKGSFTNLSILNTNDRVTNDLEFYNSGTISINAGSEWFNNNTFTNEVSGTISCVQDFHNLGSFNNNGKYRNLVRTRNAGTFTNNAFLNNIGDFTNELSGIIHNNELLLQEAGNIRNLGELNNGNWLLSDECSTISNDGTINNSGNLEMHAVLFQRGSLLGTALNCQGCYVHNSADSNAPDICSNSSFGADINGDVKVYATALIEFENFDSCSNIIYLANGIERPVFDCADIGNAIDLNVVIKTRLNDSLTCTATITPIDVLEPQFENCPTDIVIYTSDLTANVEWDLPSFTDNCTPVNIIESHQSGDSFPIGITGVSYTGSDEYGNSNSCQFRVDVKLASVGNGCSGDSDGPTFLDCPDDIVVSTAGFSANATWVAPQVEDYCYPVSIVGSHIPGYAFQLGTTTVTYTAVDGNNNENTCSFDVTVNGASLCGEDLTAPSISNCPANIYLPANPATNSAVAIWAAPNVYDLCGVSSITSSHNPGTVFPAGTTIVTYSATDLDGNSSTCNFKVTVGDHPCPGNSSAPVFTGCPSNISVMTESNAEVITWNAPTVSSTCGAVTLNSNFQSGDVFPLGITKVIYQASDDIGSVSTCSFNVSVQNECSVDDTAPVISNCPSNIVLANVGGIGIANWSQPTATDDCGLIIFSSSYLPGAAFPLGTTTIVYTAIDIGGNISSCEFNISVVDISECTSNGSPINLSTNIDPSSVQLSWNSAALATSYDVYLGTSNPPVNLVASNVMTTNTSANGLQGGSTYYWYVVPKNIMGNAVGCESTTTQFTTSGNPTSSCNLSAILVASSTNLNYSDGIVKNRLEDLGFEVTVINDNYATTSDADGKGLIIISSTVSSTYVGSKFRDVKIPVVCYESWLYDDMGMTGNSSGYDYGTDDWEYYINVVGSSHPIAAGISGNTTIFNNNNTVTWGRPSSSADVVARVAGSSSRAAIFAYDEGDQMIGMAAPAKRVGFFLHNDNADNLTNAGAALFDAAVQWAVGLQTPGTACNDGNAFTYDDVILSDGCSCQGTPCTGKLDGLYFYNLSTNADAVKIENGGVYNLYELPNSFNIRADVSGGLESVRFNVSGNISDTHTENVDPYHYSGDNNPLSLPAGDYTVSVSIHTEDQANGGVCDQVTFNFTITDTPPCDPVQMVCESNINDNGWTNHDDCVVTVCHGDKLILSVNPNGAQFSSITGPNGYSATSSGGNDFLISNNIDKSFAGDYYIELIDAAGCPGSTVITVLVDGAPVAVCKNITVQLPAVGQSVQISGTDIDGGSSAGCSGTITSLNVSTSSFSQPGDYSVTLTVTNLWGLSSACSANVTVIAPNVEENPCIGASGTGLLREMWYGINQYDISNLTNHADYPNNPAGSYINASSVGPSDIGNNYGTRVRGFITPSVSGNYTFYVTGDDQTQLFLSSNSDAANAAKIAEITGWTNQNEFYKYGSQKSGSIHMNAGQSYYVELLHVEIGGGDHWGIHWVKPGSNNPTSIPVQHLAPFDTECINTIIQTGEITIEQSNSSSWYWVNFEVPFTEKPIVVLGPPSANSTEQVIPRIKSITKDGFEFQVDEWEYLNGYHPVETMYYLAVLPGNHEIDGVEIEAGSVNENTSWDNHYFNQSFNNTPILLQTVASYNDDDAVTTRVMNLSNNGFRLKLQEEESKGSHSSETVNYIAIEKGSFQYGGLQFIAANTSNSVTDAWYKIEFGSNFTNLGFMASMHTYDGGDPCALRHRKLNGSNVEIKVEEEQSYDSETGHTTEEVGWLVFGSSQMLLGSEGQQPALHLQAVKEEEHCELYWRHNRGEEVDAYILEKSADGKTFSEISSNLSKGGNKDEMYDGYDLEPLSGDNFYRIKMENKDGSYGYSEVVLIHFTDVVDFELFPNPANDFVKIDLEQVIGAEGVTIQVFNNLGIEMKRFEIDKVWSKYRQLDIRDLREGHYTIWLDIPARRPLAKQLIIGKL